MTALQASTSYSVGFGISSVGTPPIPSRHRDVVMAKVEPTEKSVEVMRKFSEQYARKSGTYFCMDKGVTSVVIKGLAEHKDTLGAPLCPCRHYDDKAAEAQQGFWNCPCVPMRERKECHCMLFLTPDNDFAGQEQKVVKESIGDGCVNAWRRSGSKRSLAESFGISANHSLIYNEKRMRGDMSERSYGCTIQNDDSCLDPKDLRLKLRRKRISQRVEPEIEQQKKVELHEKVSRSIRSLELPERSLLRYIPSSRGAAVPPQMESTRSSDASRATNEARPISQEKVAVYSSGFSTLKSIIDELPHVPPLESSRPRVPLPTTSMPPVNSGKLVKELPPVTGGMPRTLYPENQPLTVNSLLHSLGLGKYVVNFLAEEVDMVALKQMGDCDLKELGIPMGPRKKILFAYRPKQNDQIV